VRPPNHLTGEVGITAKCRAILSFDGSRMAAVVKVTWVPNTSVRDSTADEAMSALRPIDRWFIDEVLPHEARYLMVARRLTRDSDEAADLVQEALLRLMNVDGWSAIANPPAYVVRTIQNIAIERVRRAKIVEFQQLSEIDAANFHDDAPDAFRLVSGQEQVARLAEAITALPERCRTVFVRRRLREQSPRQIAGELGISLSTFEKRLARALYLLTRALDAGKTSLEPEEGDRDGDSRAIG
jgi:RNA polymerase sigma factor (sigma-70 family)